MARSLLFKRPNPLAFPGGSPGFDPSHVASRAVAFSSASVNGNHTNLLRGQPGTIQGSPSAFIDGNIGPATKLALNGQDGLLFSGVGPSGVLSYNAITLAGIFVIDTSNENFNAIISTDAGNQQGHYITQDTSSFNALMWTSSGVAVNHLPFVVLPATPYFVAISSVVASAIDPAHGVVVNLLTGQIQTFSGLISSILSANPTSGTYCVGNIGTSLNFGFGGKIAATMVSKAKLSLPELLQWAQDPWSFWYPRKTDFLSLLRAATNATFSRTVNASSAGTVTILKSIAKSLPVASNSAVSFVKSIAKSLPVASNSAVSFVKSIAKKVSATSAGAVSFLKNVTKTVLATSLGAVTLTAIKVKLVIVSATSTGTVVVNRMVGKIVAATSTGSTSFGRAIVHTVNVTSTTATSFVKSIGKIVSAAASAVVTITQNIGAAGHFVYNVVISVASITFTQWLARKVAQLTRREALPRDSGWPAAPRDDN
jgi:hypothetical protein